MSSRKQGGGDDRLYQIGEVSRMGGLSQRMLRHYDELGLMEPDVVGENGYRYYSRQTMLKIPVINYLKMMGFSLDEIASMQRHSNLLEARKLLGRHLEICEDEARRLSERREAIVDWAELVEEASTVLRVRPSAVSVKFLSSCELLCLPSRFSGSFADAIVSLDFASFVSDVKNVITGPVILGFDSVDDAVRAASEGRECDVRLLQKPMHPISGETSVSLPAGMYLSAYHIGAFEDMGSTYRRVLQFAQESGYRPCGMAYERFVTDFWTTSNPDLFVTEVLLPTETE